MLCCLFGRHCRLKSSYIYIDVWHSCAIWTCNFRFEFISKRSLNYRFTAELILNRQGFGVFNISVLVLFHNNLIIQHREHQSLAYGGLQWVKRRNSTMNIRYALTIGISIWLIAILSIWDSLLTIWRLVRWRRKIFIRIIDVRLNTWNLCYFLPLLSNSPSIFSFIYWISFKDLFAHFIWVYLPIFDELFSVLLDLLDSFVVIPVVEYLKRV